MNNNKLLPKLMLISTALLFTACQTVPEPTPLPKELRVSSVVSTSSRDFAPHPGATLSWRNDIVVHAPPGTPADPDQLSFIKQQLDSQLLEKGYRLVGPGESSDYVLQGLMVLGDKLNEKELRDILGFEPGLAAGVEHEKGSLLLMLLDPLNNATQWRPAVQIYVSQDLPVAVREERARFGVASLLRPLPSINVTP